MLTSAVKFATIVLMMYGTCGGFVFLVYAYKHFPKAKPIKEFFLYLWALPTLLLLMFVLLGLQVDLMYQNNDRTQIIHEQMMKHNQ